MVVIQIYVFSYFRLTGLLPPLTIFICRHSNMVRVHCFSISMSKLCYHWSNPNY